MKDCSAETNVLYATPVAFTVTVSSCRAYWQNAPPAVEILHVLKCH